MPKPRRPAIPANALLILAAFAGAAHAFTLPQRTFVSGTGNDSNTVNNCSIAFPCRGFTAALTVTRSGGEIIVLSSAGYGTATISQPVSIISPPGVYAGISVPSGDGVIVNAPAALVRLEGLTITGLGGGVGINVVNAGEIQIARTKVSGMVLTGILVSTASKILLSDVEASNNAVNGIAVGPLSTPGTFAIARSTVDGNGQLGILIDANAVGTASHIVASSNAQWAIQVSNAGHAAISDCAITTSQGGPSSGGINVTGSAQAHVARCSILATNDTESTGVNVYNASALVEDTAVTGNNLGPSEGFEASGASPGSAVLTLVRSSARGSHDGAICQGDSATLRLDSNTFVDNAFSINRLDTCVVETRGSNTTRGGGNNGTPYTTINPI